MLLGKVPVKTVLMICWDTMAPPSDPVMNQGLAREVPVRSTKAKGSPSVRVISRVFPGTELVERTGLIPSSFMATSLLPFAANCAGGWSRQSGCAMPSRLNYCQSTKSTAFSLTPMRKKFPAAQG